MQWRVYFFLCAGPEEDDDRDLGAGRVLPGPGRVEITSPLSTFLDAFLVVLPTLQFSARITTLATATGVPASFTTLQDASAGAVTLSVALAELFAGTGSLSGVVTVAVSP